MKCLRHLLGVGVKLPLFSLRYNSGPNFQYVSERELDHILTNFGRNIFSGFEKNDGLVTLYIFSVQSKMEESLSHRRSPCNQAFAIKKHQIEGTVVLYKMMISDFQNVKILSPKIAEIDF